MKQPSITTLPTSPEADRHARMLKYSVAMGIRILCILSLIWLRGWWLVIPALGAVFLPYFAVVIANAQRSGRGSAIESPGGGVVRYEPPEDTSSHDEGPR